MRRFGRILTSLLSLVASCGTVHAQAPQDFSPDEVRNILRHGPWPPPVERDPSNRVSGNTDAVALGRTLFFDTRLSKDNTMSCATCHMPGFALADGLDRAQGRVRLDRNAPGLWNVARAHWYGWDGATDSLWAFIIRPMLNPDEMAATSRHIVDLVHQDATLVCLYGKVFGVPVRDSLDRQMSNVAKAIAAYLETLVSGKSPFDLLYDALVRGDTAAAANYPADARRGLSLFFGRGQCATCHVGPNFSNGEFHDIGIPYMVAPGRVDSGRHGGIKLLLADRFNRLGEFSDDLSRASAGRTVHVVQNHATYGQFKVPSLRNIELTAPYMHDGRLKTLRDVLRHYSELPEDRLHQDGEALLKPLHLSEADMDSLVTFLRTLTSREFPTVDVSGITCR